MRKFTELFAILLLVTGLIASDEIPQKVIDLAKTKLMALGEDPVIVKAVKAENEKGKSLDEIKAKDKKWIDTPGIDDFMKSLMNNECGIYLRKLQVEYNFIAEIFVMDNQGANVAMSDKTSDYWQGDEDKFTESFNDGKGGLHISEVKFDQSSQSYLIQISVPVKDDEKVIGAITFGIDIDMVE